ncbi:hypothetical protein [Desulfobotulus sp.]|jgi:hypothetical protein|uniref:hypothetical protein n=1 Tax=Desulfobotulus sp. TaxID=1940337 RepID=UPI002A361FBA|nr:hypothetical protein [Desulfobotulus sp.]MDY0161623.1 hypothetical protein [Desulfobotulus sp.]
MDSDKTMGALPHTPSHETEKKQETGKGSINADAMVRVFVENQSHAIHAVIDGMDEERTGTETKEGNRK